MDEKKFLVVMIACLSLVFIFAIILMLRWAKTRTDLCEIIYRRSDLFVKTRKYKFLLLGSYVFPMCVPHDQTGLRLFLMSLFFLLLFPFGIKVIIGRTKSTVTHSRVEKNAPAKSDQNPSGGADVG